MLDHVGLASIVAMGLMESIMEHGGGMVGPLAKKFGIPDGAAKSALDQLLPFVKGKLGGSLSLPGRGASLADKIRGANLKAFASDPSKLAGDDVDGHASGLLDDVDGDEQEAHVQKVARSTGLDPGVIRGLMPAATVAAAGALHADGHLDAILKGQQDLIAKLAAIAADAKDGKLDGK